MSKLLTAGSCYLDTPCWLHVYGMHQSCSHVDISWCMHVAEQERMSFFYFAKFGGKSAQTNPTRFFQHCCTEYIYCTKYCMRPVKASYSWHVVLRFSQLTPVDPKWALTSIKHKRLFVLGVVQCTTNQIWDLSKFFLSWDIVFVQGFHNLTQAVDMNWPLTSTKNKWLLLLCVAHLYTNLYEICPIFPSWDIVFSNWAARHSTHVQYSSYPSTLYSKHTHQYDSKHYNCHGNQTRASVLQCVESQNLSDKSALHMNNIVHIIIAYSM